MSLMWILIQENWVTRKFFCLKFPAPISKICFVCLFFSKLSLDRQSHVSHQSGHYADTTHGGHPISPDIDPHDLAHGNILSHGHRSSASGRHHHHRRRRRLLSSLSTDESYKDVYDEFHPKIQPRLRKGTHVGDYTSLDLESHHAHIEKTLRFVVIKKKVLPNVKHIYTTQNPLILWINVQMLLLSKKDIFLTLITLILFVVSR